MKASNKHKEQTIASEQYCPTLSEEYQELFRGLTKRLKDTLPMNRARIIGDELRRASEAAEENDLECKKYMAALSVLVDLSLQGWIFDFQDNQLVLKMENDTFLSFKAKALFLCRRSQRKREPSMLFLLFRIREASSY